MSKKQHRNRYRCHHLQGGKGSTLRVIDCMKRQKQGECPALKLGPCKWDWRNLGKDDEERIVIERGADGHARYIPEV